MRAATTKTGTVLTMVQEPERSHIPLAERMRPRSLDEVVGQAHLLGPRGSLRALVETDRLGSVVLWGPPGSGKTTLARLVATSTQRQFLSLSATSSGVKDVRAAIESAREHQRVHGGSTIVFIDEVHRFNKSQQDALLPVVEDGTISLIGATTENPYFEVNAPLLSRSTLLRLEALDADALTTLARRAAKAEAVTIEDTALVTLVEKSAGDARSLLTALDVAISLAENEADPGNGVVVLLDHVQAAMPLQPQGWNASVAKDTISAFIKSIRGSDVDAGLYWLARMLAAGEDPKYIARRLVILASEDIGEADPHALVIATAAAQALQFVGLPEARLNLAQAVVHLAQAPKSNAVIRAMDAAEAALRRRGPGEVPHHLRDTHYRAAESLGHGVGYRYPHDFPEGWVEQTYRPKGPDKDTYYKPTEHGFERTVKERLSNRKPKPDPI